MNTKSVNINWLVSPICGSTRYWQWCEEAITPPEAEALPKLTPNVNTEQISCYLQALAMQG
jgi:hypothetical protein